ncbi:hypothetical protein Taro_031314 [Colocasia esculenta]|uniref:Vesicle-fusing ATPase n=1 Tax=Colocasia esculenta TaxID=4460 RepID=A0A843VNL5_COLES|nr:hypothetical protein [Colocasia esculenta]
MLAGDRIRRKSTFWLLPCRASFCHCPSDRARRPRPPSSPSKPDADHALGHHRRCPSRTPTAPSATIVVVPAGRSQGWVVIAASAPPSKVLGPDRPGRVSGVGTGPTPTSMWGNESKEALRTENRLLMQRMEELETTMAKKFSKMESMIRGSQAKNDGNCAPSPHVDVHTTSAVEGQNISQDVKCIIDCGDLIGKRVLLVDIEMQHVADGILVSTEIEKVVMGRKIGTEYCEDLGGITGGSHLLQTIRENLCGCVPYWQVRLGIKHVKGMLLYGPPGTGKTLMARQIVKLLNGREPKAHEQNSNSLYVFSLFVALE